MSGLLTLHQLLATGIGLLATMAAMSWLVLRRDALQKRLLLRIATTATPYAHIGILNEMGRRRVAWSGAERARAFMGRLIGYEAARAAHYPIRGSRVVAGSLLAALVLSQIAVVLLGPSARLAIPVLGIIISRQIFGLFEQKRAAQLYKQFPDALTMIVRAARVGVPVSEAIRSVSREALEPTAGEFGALRDQLSIGVALDEALGDMAIRSRLPEYRFFATALSLQAQTGGGLTETLEGLAEVIRKRMAVRQRAHALASEARTSTYILAALPVFTGAALAAMNPAYISVLFMEPTGRAVLATAIGMLATGMFVMRTTITRSLR